MTIDNRTPDTQRPRPSAIFELALSVGELKGMVGQALTYLGDYGKKIEEHEKRIVELETQERIRKSQIALISALVTIVVSGLGWIIQNIDKVL
ncbi:hypothetical protein [Rhizobium sp. 18065]|uniref:hypothetical protein n=1 Tax=Rhizobium sp. 18065 TaxID=2681411 RepID=UPI00135703EE|nr:hypothetical protein [Rhizobium sp. 18065]